MKLSLRTLAAAFVLLLAQAGGFGPNSSSPVGPTGSFASKIIVPAAGANANAIVPPGKKWRLISAEIVVTTDANIATRTMKIFVSDGVNSLQNSASAVTQAASIASVIYVFAPTPVPSPSGTAVGSQLVFAYSPQNSLGPGFTFGTILTNIQVGDTISLRLNVEEYND